jgi:hypothetical protein
MTRGNRDELCGKTVFQPRSERRWALYPRPKDDKPGPTYTMPKHGQYTATPSAVLKAASNTFRGRKPSMPKLPWEEI